MRRLAWVFLIASSAWPQDSLSDSLAMPRLLHERDLESSPAEPPAAASSGRAFFDLHAATPFDDFQLGGRVGFFTGSRVLIDFFLDFEMRPYRRAVRIRESETLEYQFREERLTLGPGVQARIPLGDSPAAFVVGGGGSLSPAWYRGSNREAPSAALGWLETGFRFWSAPSGADWGFSYQYFPLPGVSPHRVAFHYGFRLDKK